MREDAVRLMLAANERVGGGGAVSDDLPSLCRAQQHSTDEIMGSVHMILKTDSSIISK